MKLGYGGVEILPQAEETMRAVLLLVTVGYGVLGGIIMYSAHAATQWKHEAQTQQRHRFRGRCYSDCPDV